MGLPILFRGSSNPTINVSATLTGLGDSTSTALVKLPVQTAITGVGSSSGIALTKIVAQATITGAGSSTSIALVQIAIAATISGTGSSLTQALTLIATSTALSGTGNATTAVNINVPATAVISGAGSSSATTSLTAPVQAVVSGSGALSAQVSVSISIAGLFSNSSNAAANALVLIASQASLSGVGSASAIAQVVLPVQTIFTGSGNASALAAVTGGVTPSPSPGRSGGVAFNPSRYDFKPVPLTIFLRVKGSLRLGLKLTAHIKLKIIPAALPDLEDEAENEELAQFNISVRMIIPRQAPVLSIKTRAFMNRHTQLRVRPRLLVHAQAKAFMYRGSQATLRVFPDEREEYWLLGLLEVNELV